MKLVIQKQTGIDETSIAECETFDDYREAEKVFDERLWATNAKIVEVREWISQIKDPNYRYLFVTFFDSLMGISSQAESMAKKFKVDPPMDFDAWLQKKDGGRK